MPEPRHQGVTPTHYVPAPAPPAHVHNSGIGEAFVDVQAARISDLTRRLADIRRLAMWMEDGSHPVDFARIHEVIDRA